MPHDNDNEWDDPVDDDEPETVPCPYCRRPILEDSPRCPHCENYVTDEGGRPARPPWWIIVGVLLCLYAVYRWVVG